METPRIMEYRFDSPAGGLLQSVVNEVLHGFRLERFDEAIGTSRKEFRQLLGHLWGLPEDGVSLNLRQVLAFHNVLRETLRDLELRNFKRELAIPLNLDSAFSASWMAV